LSGWTVGTDGIASIILISSSSPKQTIETDPIKRVNISTFRVFMRKKYEQDNYSLARKM
jgi:hypothetical protein